MDKKSRNIAICLLLGLTAFALSANANDINKVDIKRSNTSASTLNVTIFTNNPYDENVAVTKKSDNKYVILMPNASGSNASNVDFSSIKDIVSDVNVKSVEDGSNKYTKVTLTTTKPVAITTSTKKSAPLTEEQKAYKNLIAQSRGYNTTTDPIKAAQAQVAVKPATVSPKPAEEPVKVAAQPAPKQEVKKATVEEHKQPSHTESPAKQKSVIEQVKNIITIAPAASSENKSEKQIKNSETAKAEKHIAKSSETNSIKNKIAENHNEEKYVKDNTLNELKQDIIKENSDKEKQLQNQKSVESVQANTPENQNKGTSNNMYTILTILLASIIGLGAFFKGIKKSLEKSASLKSSFKEHLKETPTIAITDYSEIVNDTSLNWQEKYQKFINSVDEINPEDGILRHIGNGEYEFVNSTDKTSSKSGTTKIGHAESIGSHSYSQLKPKTDSRLKSYNKPAMNSSPDKVPPIKKVKNQSLKPTDNPKLSVVSNTSSSTSYKDVATTLERTLKSSPSIERTNLNEDIMLKQIEKNLTKKTGDNLYDMNELVKNEESSISNTMKSSHKLKSFANKIALEETKRNLPLPKHRSEIIRSRNVESKHVNLENSELYASPRKLADANLSSAALIAKSGWGSGMKSSSVSNPIKNNGPYSTISIDEFFDAMDSSSRATAPASLSSKVADRLGKMSVEYKNSNSQTHITNWLKGKTVKSGYNIDRNSGFYLVADNSGKTTLIGSVNNNITVLKEYSGEVTTKLQVRQDEKNVYMVRVGSERFLVEIKGNNMGILIEL